MSSAAAAASLLPIQGMGGESAHWGETFLCELEPDSGLSS